MSPNLIVEAAPNRKSRFFGRGLPRFLHLASHFLADDMEVRRAERGIKPNGKMNRIPFGFISNFLLFAFGKTSKFPVKESDNFCPKAIRKYLQPCRTLVNIGLDTNRNFFADFCRNFKIAAPEEQLCFKPRKLFVSGRVALLGFIS